MALHAHNTGYGIDRRNWVWLTVKLKPSSDTYKNKKARNFFYSMIIYLYLYQHTYLHCMKSLNLSKSPHNHNIITEYNIYCTYFMKI